MKKQSWLAVNPLPCDPQIGVYFQLLGSLLWKKSWLCHRMNGMHAIEEHSFIHQTFPKHLLCVRQGWTPYYTHVISFSSLHKPLRWVVSSFTDVVDLIKKMSVKFPPTSTFVLFFSDFFTSIDVMNSTIHYYYIIKQLMIFYCLPRV